MKFILIMMTSLSNGTIAERDMQAFDYLYQCKLEAKRRKGRYEHIHTSYHCEERKL